MGQGHNGRVKSKDDIITDYPQWETKILTVQPQYRGYFLRFGYYFQDHDLIHEGFEAEDIHLAMSKAPSNGIELWPNNFAKVTVRPSADYASSRKRISGRL